MIRLQPVWTPRRHLTIQARENPLELILVELDILSPTLAIRGEEKVPTLKDSESLIPRARMKTFIDRSGGHGVACITMGTQSAKKIEGQHKDCRADCIYNILFYFTSFFFSKSLLRHPTTPSELSDMANSSHFNRYIPEVNSE
ncbi:hypothetical protein BU17DRAFT_64415 [Hysterangium stoloniferum]|nr:hypothetical protein BU17DRAFT_64415 [Hysterangium stoloniferum]